MPERIHIASYLSMYAMVPVIDVRTPSEFRSGHIPGAVNIPLFSDEERARVGTLYKQVSPDKAYEAGYDFVAPKLEYFVAASRKVAINNTVAVYCWRGGMRSRSFAEHIEKKGVEKVLVIEGGYKAFRQYALESFQEPKQLLVIGGYTGSGKTRILKELESNGEQVIDLEGIAHHKGSAFGSIGQKEQPSNEHFTNLLFWEWIKLDTGKRVWVEDESIHIGRVFIPEVLFQRMRNALVFFLDIPREVRAHLLVEEYTGIDAAKLADAIVKISKRLGGDRTREALEALDEMDYYQAALITLTYYDKYYLKGLRRRDQEKVEVIKSDTTDATENTKAILASAGD